MAAKCPRPRVLVCKLESSRHALPSLAQLKGPCDVVTAARTLVGDEAREHLVAFYMSAKHCVTAFDVFTIGGLSAVEVDPGAILRGAIMVGAPSFVTAHNHPSGDATPSDADLSLWRELDARAQVLGLTHLDSLIIGADEYFSRTDRRVVPLTTCPVQGLSGHRRVRSTY